ncbi:NACHT domain-containing protein, partial [Paenibacillus phytohabitans]|uniref:NACHT domain-containing protein n=1 Tax=Paenibacillus phytohabitans TaxID=2654978 RepID=UPI003008FFA4
MGDYDFNRFNSRDFEHFIQALSKKILGNGTLTFGDGPDGGREAIFNGNAPFPSANDQWNGYWVIQAKYKNRTEEGVDDFSWVKKQLEEEMTKFEIIKEKGGKIPDNYLFFTNTVLTGVRDKGGRDKIEGLCDYYRNCLIPNITVFGYDDLCRILDNNRDIATAYSSFTLPGDVLFQLRRMLEKMNGETIYSIDVLIRFLEKEFKDDMVSRLEQGGQLTDEKVNLEKVFIDLNIVSKDTKKRNSSEEFVRKCIHLGDNINKTEREDLKNRLVLIGGPGQGKSTLTQFLCQIYRAFFLKNNSHGNLMHEVNNFINDYSDLAISEPICVRFPFRVILKDYAGWMIKHKENNSVIEYIQYKIETKGKGSVSLKNLRDLFSSVSFLFIFDGLDEVPSSSNRTDVLNEINDFLDMELRGVNCDTVVIGTTRPQGYTKEFDSNKFEHYELEDLTKKACEKYLYKLMENFEYSFEQKSLYLEILSSALNDPVIKRLMMSPLQATIMAILVRSGGEPPRNRYNLFTQYYSTILSREKQKGVVKVLNDENSDYIDLIHYKLGFMLQKNSEGFDNPASSVSYEEFSGFVLEILVEDMGIDTKYAETIRDDVLFAITDRLVFISEVEDLRIGFNIRSMQEYFAANYYLHNQPDRLIPERITTIAKNIYWRNTFLFAMGYLAKYKAYLIDTVLSICGDLNGDSQDYGEITTEKITKLGSWLALDLLCEGVFRSRQREENKFCLLLEELFKITPIDNHRSFSKLPDYIQERYIEKFIEKYISNSKSIQESITAWTIACYIENDGN